MWEVFLLRRKGRLQISGDFATWAAGALNLVPVTEAPLTFDVVVALATVNLPRSDPADLFLAASAKVFGLTLVTADRNLIKTSGISVLAN